jgi:molybdopterin converting factor small subunit
MKTSYELAMERLGKSAAGPKLTAAQKKALAELDSRYQARIAEREIFLQEQLARALDGGDAEAVEQLQKQLASERRKFQEELEERKDAVRRGD